MIFNSVTYLAFLLVVVLMYWSLSKIPRLWLIFIASIIFYGFWHPGFLLVMLLSTSADYYCAICIDKTKLQKNKRFFLGFSLLINLGLLCYFKYLTFIMGNAVYVLNFFGLEVEAPILEILLPLGISFYTFESLSYIIDVYRGFIKPEKSLLLYGCFVTFFPKLIAGPILRAAEMLPQFIEQPRFRLDIFVSGLRRILYGLFLKVVLADNIAPIVDSGFLQPISNLSALDVLTLAFLFGFQIYFDFSAYSSIAIGSARLIGIHIPENFNFPYLSTSPREFWQRWHISLSSWIRDYLYFPLQGVKVKDRYAGGLSIDIKKEKGLRSPTFALFLTWSIMGLWHGASWTFVIWGLFHAVLIAIYRLTKNQTTKLPRFVQIFGGWAFTLIFVMLAWIPFRAKTVEDTFAMLSRFFSIQNYLWLGMHENIYIISALLFIFVISAYFFHIVGSFTIEKNRITFFAANIIHMTAIILLVFVFIRPISQFIYFQF